MFIGLEEMVTLTRTLDISNFRSMMTKSKSKCNPSKFFETVTEIEFSLQNCWKLGEFYSSPFGHRWEILGHQNPDAKTSNLELC